ncbi:MAG TPA: hypothetical protein DCP71_10125 [Verrucomicrobiales bacterium]|jgi:serine/threonine protein kinase/peroxiredoxin|nr:hypothetical protein [Verrucomicrobiales bacterium]
MSEPTPSFRPCPQCGEPVTESTSHDLCPVCLMGVAMNWTQATQPVAVPQKPLTPEELAPHFPQLEVLELIGRGGMGVVYKAKQKSLDRFVALKLLSPDTEKDRAFAQRFATEARALAQMVHQNIVTVYDFGESGGFYYLLMEYVDGVNLRQAMQGGRITPEQALAIVPPVCEALQYAHERGIVHRDIKPENLLLNKQGQIKIADFGIAKMVGHAESPEEASGSPHEAHATFIGGTPPYMAPEQKERAAPDHRADIYSLGVVLYELLTGELPTASLRLPSTRIQVDVRLDEIVLRALEKSPELRFQTAADFRTQLATIHHAPQPQTPARKSPARKASTLQVATLSVIGTLIALFSLIAVIRMVYSKPGRTSNSKYRLSDTRGSGDMLKGSIESGIIPLLWHAEGGRDRVGSYKPTLLKTTPTQPENITRIPDKLIRPFYAQVKLGSKALSKFSTLTFLVDRQVEKTETRVILDSNGNGDLTDDAPAQLEHAGKLKDGRFSLSGIGWASLPYEGEHSRVSVRFHTMPQSLESESPPTVVYSLDSYAEGKIQGPNGTRLTIALRDSDGDGDFSTGAAIHVDTDGDGDYRRTGMYFPDATTFQINQFKFLLSDISPSGTSMVQTAHLVPQEASKNNFSASQTTPSQTTPKTRLIGPKILPGEVAPAFTATTMNHGTVEMPKSYQGKLLLLDFWATWCGPCIRELPNVSAAYEKYHDQGLEILSISLDTEKSLDNLPAILTKHRMVWPQVCDAAEFDSALVKLYGVRGIPATVLIDGDTGKILATDLRGTSLETQVAEALAKRKR